eukprot:CAMPEP_0115875568 /NCGR_PEP_ID=MMETSP0287-20121206/25165_1 /TAXON_ID=412157 /ORGANISM="Chrysochromulina rotalis, Strain UIO044" /LENGTH=33 /DNA_ID= /DNA_START= /DNA_END= /DNA_ORIENTATION=
MSDCAAFAPLTFLASTSSNFVGHTIPLRASWMR